MPQEIAPADCDGFMPTPSATEGDQDGAVATRGMTLQGAITVRDDCASGCGDLELAQVAQGRLSAFPVFRLSSFFKQKHKQG